MKLQPLQDWAVIRPSEAGEMTAGGLYIPDTAKDKPQEGVVEAIGPGAYEEEKFGKKKKEKKERRFITTSVKPGDQVIYERYAGQTYQIDGEERILVRERDILGILLERSSRADTSQPKLPIPASTSVAASTSLAKRESKVDTTGGKKKKETKEKKAMIKKVAKAKTSGLKAKKQTKKKTGKKKK